MTRWTTALLLLAAGATSASAYDSSWYRTTGWSGEYPGGFTMTEDATVAIRQTPDPDAPQTTACDLMKDATYHQWNAARVAADGLEFIAWNKIETYEARANFTISLGPNSDAGEVDVRFRKGDRWEYLTYVAEGAFLMRFAGSEYFAGEDLIEKSLLVGEPSGQEPNEWVRLKCANGTTGWLLMKDVRDLPAFGPPNLIGYGEAADGAPDGGN